MNANANLDLKDFIVNIISMNANFKMDAILMAPNYVKIWSMDSDVNAVLDTLGNSAMFI